MSYAIIVDGSPKEVSGAFTDETGIQHSASVLRCWSDEELFDIGVYKIEEPELPEFDMVTGSHLMFDGISVHRVYHTIPADLDEERRSKKQQIDAEAECVRMQFITPGSGQAMSYQEKTREAQRYLDSNGEGEYPLLSKEVGITSGTLEGVAMLVLTMHNEWLDVGGKIVRARLLAKKQVDEASTVGDVRAITPIWFPIDGVGDEG